MITTRRQWIDSILNQNNIDPNSDSYYLLQERLNVIFEKASIKVKEDYLVSTRAQTLQVVPAAGSTSLAWILAIKLVVPMVSISATTILAATKFITSAGATMVAREIINRSWKEADIIKEPLVNIKIPQRLRRPLNDTNLSLSNEAWLLRALDSMSTELPNLGCKTSFFKSAAAGLVNGVLETKFGAPGIGTVIGTRVFNYGSTALKRFSGR